MPKDDSFPRLLWCAIFDKRHSNLLSSHSLIIGVPGAGAADDPAVRKTIIPARGDMMRITD